MSSMDVNYFICTLGQAAKLEREDEFKTIPEFLQLQASLHPRLPAVGFYLPSKDPSKQLKHQVLAFDDVYHGTTATAKLLEEVTGLRDSRTVALLCPSSPAFLFTWLALMQMGHPVLLIAPQCTPAAIAQLCKDCDVRVLFHDQVYTDLAQKACNVSSKSEDAPLHSRPLSFSDSEDVFQAIRQKSDMRIQQPNVSEMDVAYLHHTSGTSTGIPKSIPQTHKAGVGVLPSLDGSDCATFTTTPLYHGGIADLFRAWTSQAMIWLFPGNEVPITAANIVKCLDVAGNNARDSKTKTPSVKYFSSVPYVLQMMAQDKDGLKHLQNMDIVGVGGAALPTEVGNDLVNKGVNLVSRFGSAECGFLLSSHRKYDQDKEWQYLRPDIQVKEIKFEGNEDRLSELVILPGWPHMAKTNRDDGSFATSDLFEAHKDLPNAWKYHSRADAQLTLITGKKFDPAPLEDAITATSSLVEDALIFGNSRPYPGVLLFRSTESPSRDDQEIMQHYIPIIEKLNKESQSHARIPRNMIRVMPHSDSGLEKSSKGTIIRGKAEERFAEEIAAAYENTMPTTNRDVPDEDLPSAILEIIESVVGTNDDEEDRQDLTHDTDLFSYGVDSVASVQIRHALSQLLPENSAPLPLTVVEDSSTIERLSKVVSSLRHGEKLDKDQDELHLMQDIARDFSGALQDASSKTAGTTKLSNGTSQGRNILLTGPTGSLGSHILHRLLQDPAVNHIFLLLRGATDHAARERVTKALTSRALSVPSDFDARCTIITCKLAQPDLGLSKSIYSQLASSIDTIVHLAWAVNFLQPLRSFTSIHIAGLTHLLNLALASPNANPPRFIFCSSVASVSNYHDLPDNDNNENDHSRIPETAISNPRVSGPTGYARSKWVAEQICQHAHSNTRLHNRISVARVGQLSGARDTGVWSKTEAYPLMLSTVKETGVLPDLDRAHETHPTGKLSNGDEDDSKVEAGSREVLNWLPVDLAAEAFVQEALQHNDIATSSNSSSSNTGDKPTPNHQQQTANGSDPGTVGNGNDPMPIHHVLSPHEHVTWTHLLRWLQKQESFKIVSADDWLSKLREMQSSELGQHHPALKLLGFWQNAYGSGSGSGGGDSGSGDGGSSSNDRNNNSKSDVVDSHEAENGDDMGIHREQEKNSDKAVSQVDGGSDGASEQQVGIVGSKYEMSQTLTTMPCLKGIQPVDEEYTIKLWGWIKENM